MHLFKFGLPSYGLEYHSVISLCQFLKAVYWSFTHPKHRMIVIDATLGQTHTIYCIEPCRRLSYLCDRSCTAEKYSRTKWERRVCQQSVKNRTSKNILRYNTPHNPYQWAETKVTVRKQFSFIICNMFDSHNSNNNNAYCSKDT